MMGNHVGCPYGRISQRHYFVGDLSSWEHWGEKSHGKHANLQRLHRFDVCAAGCGFERNDCGDEAPFDLIFIDADKDSYTQYLQKCLPLLREGGLLLGDNTLRGVYTMDDCGTMRYNTAIEQCPELTSIIIPILRNRGLDGLTVSFKRSPEEEGTVWGAFAFYR
ncbi:hypothetical protein EON83_26595 [bacterium]|nr:MAG: hypothetical protein EON83_26595 [bacterium]